MTDADVVASMIQMFGSCDGGPNSNHINHGNYIVNYIFF